MASLGYLGSGPSMVCHFVASSGLRSMKEAFAWAQASSVMLLMLYHIDFLNIKYLTHFQKKSEDGSVFDPVLEIGQSMVRR
ncbi:MAG: hypothetical protein ACK56F_29850, partial [bacterium]